MWAQQGVYKPTKGADRTISFELKNGVALYGGFAGSETVREQRDWGIHATVLSGDIDNNDLTNAAGLVTDTANISGANSYHVVTSSEVTGTAVLDGFFITAGQAKGDFPNDHGGGMLNTSGSSPMLTNLTFSGNSAAYGGGIYNNSTLLVTNSTFSDNSVTYNGGGIYNSGTLIVMNGRFPRNSATTYGASWGAGIYNNGTLTVTNSTLSGNSATYGGSIANFGTLTVINSTLSGNHADWGSGITNYGALTVTNSTLSGNFAANWAAGIYNNTTSAPFIQNSIFWNEADAATQIGNTGSSASPVIRFSLVQGCKPGGVWNAACGTDGGNNLADADPLFVAPEPASSAPTTAGNYRLQDASPAINMGDNAADLDNPSGLGTATISSIFSDLDGNPRFVRVFVDLGAYENQTFLCPAGGVLYVDQDASGAQTGASWADALVTLQDALQVSEACKVWVTGGVYYPDVGGSHAKGDRNAAFLLKTGMQLYGGFSGTETARDQRNWRGNVTVLSGDIDGNDRTDLTGVITTTTAITGTNSYTVVSARSTDSSALLDGFSITGAWPMPANWNAGGGMYTQYSNATVKNVIFTGNQATFGGGLYNSNSSPSLSNVTFSGNQAGEGGGLYNASSSPLLTNITFLGNRADSGGGMYNWGSFPTIINAAFIDNQAEAGGGGVYNIFSNPVLVNTTFSSNQANSGGGMHNFWNSNPRLQNSILWGNGGLQVYNDNSTVPESPSIPVFTSSLVQGCHPSGIWDNACGTDGGNNLPDADPLFVDSSSGNLRLRPNSPAIDAGNNYSVTVTTDLAGSPRFVDIPAAPDTGLGTPPLVDLGAYEASFVDAGILKTVYPLEAVPGQTITYTLTFSNGGSLPAVGVVITDVVPAFLTIQGVEFGGAAITDTGHLPPYAWAVQTLAAGQEANITLTAILSAPLSAGVYTNNASITAREDAVAGNNHSEVRIRVLNVAPLAVGDSYTTLEDTPLQIMPDSVLANDSDNNGDALTAFKNSNPGHGLLLLNLNGSFVYTPTLNTNGPDSFTYRARDGALNSNIAMVNLSIRSVNDAPAGTNQTVITLEDADYMFATLDFGFTDPSDSPANTFNRVKITNLPGKGTLKLNGTAVKVGQFVRATDITAGLLTFTPASNAWGAPYTSFTFQVEDDGGTANGGVNLDPTPNAMTISVPSVNDAPIAAGDRYTTTQYTSLKLAAPGILANDTDIESSPLTAILDGAPAHGLLSLYPNGSFVYTPTLGIYGLDSFTYHASDGVLNSEIVTVTLIVQRGYRIFLPIVQPNYKPPPSNDLIVLLTNISPKNFPLAKYLCLSILELKGTGITHAWFSMPFASHGEGWPCGGERAPGGGPGVVDG